MKDMKIRARRAALALAPFLAFVMALGAMRRW